jgi:hypothetical protein
VRTDMCIMLPRCQSLVSSAVASGRSSWKGVEATYLMCSSASSTAPSSGLHSWASKSD